MGFLCVVPVAAFIAIKQKRRIEQTLAVSIFGIILLIYLSGLFTSFLPGIICHWHFAQCVPFCCSKRSLQDGTVFKSML